MGAIQGPFRADRTCEKLPTTIALTGRLIPRRWQQNVAVGLLRKRIHGHLLATVRHKPRSGASEARPHNEPNASVAASFQLSMFAFRVGSAFRYGEFAVQGVTHAPVCPDSKPSAKIELSSPK